METTMQIVVPEGMAKKEWFSVKEFAAGVQTTPHAVNQWLNRHPDFTSKYCQNISTGQKRKKWLIFWEGISVFISRRSNNGKPSDSLNLRVKEVAQENVGKMANQTIKQQSGQPSELDKLVLISQNLAAAFGGLSQKVLQIEQSYNESRAELQKVNARLEQHEKELEKPLPITSIHRQFLNDRVRLYAIQTKIEFRRVWQAINTHVGRGGVSFYEFKDFQIALKYLKDMYEEAGMPWSEN